MDQEPDPNAPSSESPANPEAASTASDPGSESPAVAATDPAPGEPRSADPGASGLGSRPDGFPEPEVSDATGVWIHRTGVPKVRLPVDTVQNLDFRNPSAFSPGVLRRLRLRHDEFVRALSARLSLYLRMEFTLQLGKLDTVPYRNLLSRLADPTHLTRFRIAPLPGICLVDVPPRLAMTIVDRLLGGPGHALTTDHTPSEIELALLSQAVHVVISEWASFWSGSQELKAVELGYENNGRFLKTSPHDAVMLALSIDSRLGECEESIQLVFPHYTIEPLVPAMGQAPDKSGSGAPTVRNEKVAWNPRYADVPVSVVAEWEGVELSARELAHLKVGDVVPLEGTCVEEVKVRLADAARFRGRLGASGGRLAVELTAAWKQ